MRTAILASGFNLLCWLIFVVKEVPGESTVEIHLAETADLSKLHPRFLNYYDKKYVSGHCFLLARPTFTLTLNNSAQNEHAYNEPSDTENINEHTLTSVSSPNEIDDLHLLNMSFNNRKKLCEIMYDKIQQSPHSLIGTSFYKPKLNRMQLQPDANDAKFNHAPKAHVYRFDDKEECPAVHCRALPPFYVSHQIADKNKHHWHIWVMKPALNHYQFRFDSIIDFSHILSERPRVGSLPPEGHHIYGMNTLKRWYLCLEARRVSNYIDEDRMYEVPPEPKVYSFRYSKNFWLDNYLAIMCPGVPLIFLRTEDTKKETNIIWISIYEAESTGEKSTTAGKDSDATYF